MGALYVVMRPVPIFVQILTSKTSESLMHDDFFQETDIGAVGKVAKAKSRNKSKGKSRGRSHRGHRSRNRSRSRRDVSEEE